MDRSSKRRGAAALVFSGIFSVSLLLAAHALAAPRGLGGWSDDARFVPGEVLVKFKQGVVLPGPAAEVHAAVAGEAARSGVDADVKKSYRAVGVHRLKVRDRGMSVEAAVARLNANPRVEFAEPNYLHRTTLIPNDPSFPSLWGLNNTGQTGGTADADIDAAEAWNTTLGSASVVIGVIDTGVAYSHPDLLANMWVNPGEIAGDGIDNDGNGYVDDVHGINAITGDGDPFDDNGHGTHVAGTIGAVGNNALGVSGVSPIVKMVACKFLSAMGGGSTADGLECLLYMVELKRNGVNIKATNNSWGGGGASLSLLLGIELARDNGILFIAAAGNDNTNNDSAPHYPSNYNVDSVISVAATDHNDLRATFSNFGTSTVHVGAPGVSILSARTNLTYTPLGTDLFFDNMEAANANWVADAPWQRTLEFNNTAGGTFAWSDSPSANYGLDANASLTSRSINLLGTSGRLALGFSARYALETNFDFLNVDFSPDGGATWYPQGWLTGTSVGFVQVVRLIPPALRTANFKFRFRLTSDEVIVADGVYIDDVGIGLAVETPAYVTLNGTSMATPHVAGLVALLAAANPTASAATLRKAILDSVDVTAAMIPRVYTGGRINARRALNWFTNAKPTVTSLTPATLTTPHSLATTHTAVFSDANGFADFELVSFLVGPTSGSATNAFWIDYDVVANQLRLKNNNGIGYASSCTPGAGAIGTTRVNLNCAGSSVAVLGNTLTLVLSLVPQESFATNMKRNVYLRATDTYNATSNWVDKGDWTIRTSNVAPTSGTLSPSVLVSAPGSARTMTAVYSDADGASNIDTVMLLVNTTASGLNGVYARYVRSANTLYLYNDAMTAFAGSCKPGAAGVINNSQVALNCAATSVVSSAVTTLTVNWNITPKPAFESAAYRDVYMRGTDYSGLTSGFVDKGNWKITSVNVAPTLGTLTPNPLTSVAGVEQTFTAIYTDADGYGNIDTVRLLVNPTSSGANGIYVRYIRATNSLYMYDNNGTSFAGSCKRGTAVILQNTQGSLNCATTTVAASGNNLTLGWKITPKAAFATGATRNVFMHAADNSGVSTGFVDKGNWTINP